MLQALPRRKDLVAADVLAHGDVHRDGTAREREFAEPAVHVPAARPPLEKGLLAMVPDDEPLRLLPLADAHPVGVVALDRRRIVGIAHERVRRRGRIFRGERRADLAQNQESGEKFRRLHCLFSFSLLCQPRARLTRGPWSGGTRTTSSPRRASPHGPRTRPRTTARRPRP